MSEKKFKAGPDRSPGRPSNPDPLPARPAPESESQNQPPAAREIGGPAGPEPTRYGDWEKNGRCSDF